MRAIFVGTGLLIVLLSTLVGFNELHTYFENLHDESQPVLGTGLGAIWMILLIVFRLITGLVAKKEQE